VNKTHATILANYISTFS